MARNVPPTSIRMSPEGREVLRALARHLGISQTSAIEVAIRWLAREEGVTVPPKEEK